MEKHNIPKVISIICSVIGLAIVSLGLFLGIGSHGRTELDGFFDFLFLPSLILFTMTLFDFLITLNKIKKGLIISWVNSIFKIGIMAFYLGIGILHPSYLASADILVIVFLGILTYPSIFNIIKLKENKKQ